MSSLNYIWVQIQFFVLFHAIERSLKDANNKVCKRAFEMEQTWKQSKQFGLVHQAMETQDAECLKIMAQAYQDQRVGFMSHIYWKDLDTGDKISEEKVSRTPFESACSVM